MENKPSLIKRFNDSAIRGFNIWKDLMAFSITVYVVITLVFLAIGIFLNFWSSVFGY